jgi:hypothetical protein
LVPLTIKRYSDALLIRLLMAARPEKFRPHVQHEDKQKHQHGHEHRHQGGSSLTQEQFKQLPAAELLRIYRQALGVPEPG